MLKVTLADIGMAPEDRLEQDGPRPRPGAWPRPGPGWPQIDRNGFLEVVVIGMSRARLWRNGMVVGSLDAVGAILAPAGVSYADLVLVVKPSLVELGPGGVEDPAAEPAPHGVQVPLVGLAVGATEGRPAGEVGTYEAIPHIEDGLDLGSQHVARAAQRLIRSPLAQQQGRLQQLQLAEAYRRAGYGVGPVGVAGDVGLAHGVLSGRSRLRLGRLPSCGQPGRQGRCGDRGSQAQLPVAKGGIDEGAVMRAGRIVVPKGLKRRDTHMRATGIRPFS